MDRSDHTINGLTIGANGPAIKTSGPAIEAKGLNRSFVIGRGRKRKSLEAVKDLSFVVEPGERVAFIGPNGAGKSTSIKMLTGILFPTAGAATVLGLVPWQQRRQLSLRIGTLFGQRSQLWNELTPRTSLGVLGAMFGLGEAETNARIAELGALLEAGELYDQPLRGQSLGQRMRCELTACMLHAPELLFLDEPTIGLDLLGKQLFRDLLVRVNDETGTTVFLTSHDVADIEHVAERAIVVNHGTIIYDNTVNAMRADLLATKRITVGLSGQELSAPILDLPGVSLETAGSTASITAPPDQAAIQVDTTLTPVRQVLDMLLAELPVTDLSITDPPLETVIGEIYQRPETADPRSALG